VEASSFADIDLDAEAGSPSGVLSRVRNAPRLVAFALGLLAVVSFYVYDTTLATGFSTVGGWDVSLMDWLTLFATVGIVAFVVVPVILDVGVLRRFWANYPKDAISLVSLAVVSIVGLLGVFGPVLMGTPEVSLQVSRQPPVYTSVSSTVVPVCEGPVVGGHCHGTWKHPLGTTRAGESVLEWTIYGARTAVQFAVVTLAIMAPIAVAVGGLSGYYGGQVDDVLSTYVDVQSAIPAVVIYFFVVYFLGPSLFALVLIFGLFSWEEMARTVRTSVVSEKSEGYVTAARSAGASDLTILRRHILPNVSSAVVTTVSTAVPKLILIEALFSFVGLSGDQSYSWGQLVRRGVAFGTGGGQGGPPMGAFDPLVFEASWWIAVIPALALTIAVLALTLFGDAVQEAVDPWSR